MPAKGTIDLDLVESFAAWAFGRAYQAGGVCEVFVKDESKGYPRYWVGWWTPSDLPHLGRALAPFAGSAHIWFGCHPSRSNIEGPRGAFGRVRRAKPGRPGQGRTGNADVLSYHLLAIDIDRADADRKHPYPDGSMGKVSATEEEKGRCLFTALRVRDWLYDTLGMGSTLADSGNGYHLLIPTAPSPEVGAAAALAKALMHELADIHDDDHAQIDRSIWDPAQVLKLYGTQAVKGPDTAERPHRLSSIDVDELRALGEQDVWGVLQERYGAMDEGQGPDATSASGGSGTGCSSASGGSGTGCSSASGGQGPDATSASGGSGTGCSSASGGQGPDATSASGGSGTGCSSASGGQGPDAKAVWLSSSQFAALAGVTKRNARLIIRRSGEDGELWRGAELACRQVPHTNGVKAWRVRADSLPPDLRAKWATVQAQRARASAPRERYNWQGWRREALERLDLRDVYGPWLTGVASSPGWLQCRDPSSPTGDRTPSAGVADGSGEAERGVFSSHRDNRRLSVFDFLEEQGKARDFNEARAIVADLSGVPLPGASSQDDRRARPTPPPDEAPRPAPPPRESEAPDLPIPLQEEGGATPSADLPTVDAQRTWAKETVHAFYSRLALRLRECGRLFEQGSRLFKVESGQLPEAVSADILRGVAQESFNLAVREWKEKRDDLVLVLKSFKKLSKDDAGVFLSMSKMVSLFPHLGGFTRLPNYTKTWRFVGMPGYDESTEIFYDGHPVTPCTSNPIHLPKVLEGFAWASPIDQINAYGMLLTILTMPHWLNGHPALVVNGNKPGVGKTTFAQLIGLLSEGSRRPTISWTRNPEEFEKQLATRVGEGDRAVIIDNIKSRGELSSMVLERLITDPRPNFRLLGATKSIGREVNDLLVILTMNDTRLGADLRRRSVPINLYLGEDVRRHRFAIGDVLDYAERHRWEILGELAGMVEHWKSQGRPLGEARHSVNHTWASTIDGILTACGLPGFLSNFETATRAFDERYQLMQEIANLRALCAPALASEWVDWLKADDLTDAWGGNESAKTPRQRSTRLGKLFGAYLDAVFIVDGRRFRMTRTYPKGSNHPPVYGFEPIEEDMGDE